jgi:hypothetical protein
VDTIKLFAMNPREAWSRTREKGDIGQPLLFAICVGWIGVAFNSVWSMIFGQAWLRFLPMNLRDQVGPMMAGRAGLTLAAVILAPIVVVIGLFIWAAILHVCFLIVGALSNSTAGFEGTVRIVGYAWVTQLAQIIPIFGGLLAFVWSLILVVMGAQALHKSTQGKAIAGVLIPIVLCCGCVLVAFLLAGAAIFSAFNR